MADQVKDGPQGPELESDDAAVRELQRRAEAMTRGDFTALGAPLGASPALEDLRRAIDVLGAHVEQAQRGWHAYIGTLTSAQEAERSRVARELHDDTVQRLIAVAQSVERAQRLIVSDPARAEERLGAIRTELTATIQGVRAVIGNLRPPALDELGLLPAVELLVRRGADSHPDLTVVVEGDPRRLDPQSELVLFRIIQEAWSNVLRHAQAQHTRLSFRYEPSALSIIIADDGRGFVPPSPGEGMRGHWGLVGMQERARLAGGTMHITSQLGQGTTVEVRMPYLGRAGRDPICGMEVGPEALSVEYKGLLYRFCSLACRELFLAQPDAYVHVTDPSSAPLRHPAT